MVPLLVTFWRPEPSLFLTLPVDGGLMVSLIFFGADRRRRLQSGPGAARLGRFWRRRRRTPRTSPGRHAGPRALHSAPLQGRHLTGRPQASRISSFFLFRSVKCTRWVVVGGLTGCCLLGVDWLFWGRPATGKWWRPFPTSGRR